MIQSNKIITSKSVLPFLIFLTTTTHCFLQNDHRETSRRSDIRENRNFPDRRQVDGKDLNIRNMVHKLDEKDRVYENLYDRRSFRTGTPEKSEVVERRTLGFSRDNRREARIALIDNRSSNNRQRFSIHQDRNAESSRIRNVNDNRRNMNRIDLDRENRRFVSRNYRMNSQITRTTTNDFENRRQTAVDRRTTSVNPPKGEQLRTFSSRTDSARRIENARMHVEREINRDARTRDARVTDSSRNNEISRSNSARRVFDRRENMNRRNLIIETPNHLQDRNTLLSGRTREIDQTRNTFASRLPQENRRDSTRNRLARVSDSSNAIRNVPTFEHTSSEFGINSRIGKEHLRENISRKWSRQSQRNTFATQERRVVPVKQSSPTVDARFDKTANAPQPKVSNSFAERFVPGKDVSPAPAELGEKSIGLQSSQESYDYLKHNLGVNSWANAAQVILGVYLIGQIFLGSSMKNKPRFHMFAVATTKNKIH